MSNKIDHPSKKQGHSSVNQVTISANSYNPKSGHQHIGNTVTSERLFAGARELTIQHAGDSYLLRITNQGKLILTK